VTNVFEPGKPFDPDGYDQIADINAGVGVGNPFILSVSIFCNNSSHFLVAKRIEDYPASDFVFEFDGAFYYGDLDEDGTDDVYELALKRAVDLALGKARGHICPVCNGNYPSDQSCPCFDNGSE
jgi:hypothetical protein